MFIASLATRCCVVLCCLFCFLKSKTKGMCVAKLALHGHCSLCSVVLAPDQLKKHAELYHSNSIMCECGCFFDFETMKFHAAYDCELLLKKCVFCSGEFPKKNLVEHSNRCKAETVKCNVCSQRFPRLHLNEHMTGHVNQ